MGPQVFFKETCSLSSENKKKKILLYKLSFDGCCFVIMFQHYVRFKVDIPSSLISELASKNIPETWQQSPAPADIQTIGHDWVKNRTSAVLKTPSAVISEHHSYLLKPNHKDFSKIKINKPSPFSFDRLWILRYKLTPQTGATHRSMAFT
jgi:hypothetical protein